MKWNKWFKGSTGYAKPDVTPPPPKRLGSSVSGAETCYVGREAAPEQVGAEARSEERRAVTPGEAELCRLLRNTIPHLVRVVELEMEDARSLWPPTSERGQRRKLALLGLLDDIRNSITAKPDNEAQRSGRRNEKVEAREE